MDILNYNFPELNDMDIAFGNVETDPKLLKEAKARGFYQGNTKYNKLFSNLFFNGGKLDLKENVNIKIVRYLKAFMGSFNPKHEEKEAISALILSEIIRD